MKKMVIYGTDRWMKELLTLSRFEKIAYFVDDKMRGGGGMFARLQSVSNLSHEGVI